MQVLDVHLIERLFDTDVGTADPDALELIRTVRSNDSIPKPVKARGQTSHENVSYRVGQVFRHKRYQYCATIIGWDNECSASEQWMAEMRVHELSRGKHQTFYHVLVEDKSMRYVAEENIRILKQDPVASLVSIAGQYFKRWDGHAKSFVSNIRDEYPDD